ncbi:hypothetical protein GCM10010278_39650 [Streptomyces melanogenes]|nr:hypothetical protein GCM10010278_39650 [Streptomyces melanogenes]
MARPDRGNMLGKPVERGDHWTRDRIDRYLRRADALPLTDYLPDPDLLPPAAPGEFELRPEWRQCVRGRVHGSCRDDDVDYAVLGLHLLETHGFAFTTEQVGELWLLRLPYLQTFTAERAAYRNPANGLKPPLTATYDNPYQEVDRRADPRGRPRLDLAGRPPPGRRPGPPRRGPVPHRQRGVRRDVGGGAGRGGVHGVRPARGPRSVPAPHPGPGRAHGAASGRMRGPVFVCGPVGGWSRSSPRP